LPGPTAPLRPPQRSPGSSAQRRAPCPRLLRSRRRPPSAAAALRAPRCTAQRGATRGGVRGAHVRWRTKVGERRIILASGTLAHGLDVGIRLGSHLPVLVRHALAEGQLCCQLQLLVVISHAVALWCNLPAQAVLFHAYGRRIIEAPVGVPPSWAFKSGVVQGISWSLAQMHIARFVSSTPDTQAVAGCIHTCLVSIDLLCREKPAAQPCAGLRP
jgi:hypothetical protein